MKPGRFSCRINDYGINQKGTPFVQFKLSESGETITWYANVAKEGKGREIAVKSLLKMGFSGKTGAELSSGMRSHVLNENVEYEITVKEDTYQGKTSLKVNYIGIAGENSVKKMDAQEAKIFIGGLNLSADFAAARATMPKPAKIPNMAPGAVPDFDSNEDIGF